MFKIPVMLEIDPLLVSVTLAKKLVIWFAVQMDWLVYIWSKHGTVTLFSPKHFKNGFANTGVRILELTVKFVPVRTTVLLKEINAARYF